MRGCRLENLADRAETRIEKMVSHGGEALQREVGIAIDAIFGQNVMAEQPGPDRALVIGAVAMPGITTIVRLVVGMVGR